MFYPLISSTLWFFLFHLSVSLIMTFELPPKDDSGGGCEDGSDRGGK